MKPKSSQEVSMFLDKFQDPTFEVSRVLEEFDLPGDDLHVYFMHKLLMKAYRLGKEHGYARSVELIRNKK